GPGRRGRPAVEIAQAAAGELARGRVQVPHPRRVVARPAQPPRPVHRRFLTMSALHRSIPSVWFPPPLRGRVRVGGCVHQSLPQAHPPPRLSPARGEGEKGLTPPPLRRSAPLRPPRAGTARTGPG